MSTSQPSQVRPGEIAAPGWDPVAIAAIVCAVLLPPVGIVLGLCSGRPVRRGSTLGMPAVVLGTALTIFLIMGAVVLAASHAK